MIDAIFVPRGSEERAVRRGLARAHAACTVVATGIGARAGTRAVDEIRDLRPSGALIVGLCGLLSPAFVVGDALVYHTVRSWEGTLLGFDRALDEHVAERVAGVQTGIRALTAATVIVRVAQKRALAERFDADAVDMETFAVAAALRERDVLVAALRVGSDGVDDELPELDRSLDGSGGIDGFALGLAMLRRPRAGVRLARNGMRALRALEAAVHAIFARAEI